MNNLEAIDMLLKGVDALICELPTPEAPEGAYFEAWGALGQVHGRIGEARDAIAAALNHPESASEHGKGQRTNG